MDNDMKLMQEFLDQQLSLVEEQKRLNEWCTTFITEVSKLSQEITKQAKDKSNERHGDVDKILFDIKKAHRNNIVWAKKNVGYTDKTTEQ
jgi:hypothetical protein|tara:strand:- start:288 stop:557 length:270 start_codon:yes stop_codon:yes gene_type:complete